MKKPVFKLFCLLLCVFSFWGCGQRPGGKTPDSRAAESKTQGSERLGVLFYETLDTGVTISGCQESAEGELVIPNEIEGLPVTSIGVRAFASCFILTSIIIPERVNFIGHAAFTDCYSLTSIIIPERVNLIGDAAFTHCYSLTSVTIPDSVTSIGKSAFIDCVSLTSVTIPDSITNIEIYAFYGCRSLTSITIPDSVTSIGDDAFYGCNGLESIVVPAAFHSRAEAHRIGDDATGELYLIGRYTTHSNNTQPPTTPTIQNP